MTEITNTLTATEIGDRFASKFGGRIFDIETASWSEGTGKTPINSVWMKTGAGDLHEVIAELISIDFPHLGVISAVDEDESIDVLYHLTVFFGTKGAEVVVNISVTVPKENPVVPTISDLIPGAVYPEREKQELMGIKVEGIPDERGLFLPDDFPKGVYPWRKDDAGIREDMIKELWAVGRPEERPDPYVKPKPEKKKKKTDEGTDTGKKPEADEVKSDE